MISVWPVRSETALVAGTGPSAAGLPWRDAASRLAVNVVAAVGRAAFAGHCTYAVAAAPDVLMEYQQRRLYETCRIVTNAPHRLQNRDLAARLGKILTHRHVWFAPAHWPPLASGPLAVWAMAALGYGKVLIYGLDGSADPEGATSLAKVREWEGWIRRSAWARRRSRRGPVDGRFALVRVWGPDVHWDREPLGRAVSLTVRLVKEEGVPS